jgi:ParB/RepB/Spo0J family partition protein
MSKNNGEQTMAKIPGGREAAKEIPISQIHVDHNWNSRGQRWKEPANDEDMKFEGLVTSIRERGLDEPVVVRHNPDPKAKQPYSLVYGFRRFEAVSQIAAEGKIKEPTILAVVRNVNEQEARSLNIRENTNRNSLATPDLAWAIAELGRTGFTDVAIAADIGKTQGYVSDLHRIMKGCPAKVLENWRSSLVPLQVKEMRMVLKTGKDKDPEKEKLQTEKYMELVKAQTEKARVKSDDEKESNKVEGMKKKAEAFGSLLGQLDALGFLPSADVVFAECISVIVPACAEADAKTKKSVAKAAEAGWKLGQDLVEQANAEEEVEETAAE